MNWDVHDSAVRASWGWDFSLRPDGGDESVCPHSGRQTLRWDLALACHQKVRVFWTHILFIQSVWNILEPFALLCFVSHDFACTCWPGLKFTLSLHMSIGFFIRYRTRIYSVHDSYYTIPSIPLVQNIWSSRASSWGLECSNGLRSLEYSSHIGFHVFIAMGRLCFCLCPHPEVGWYGFGKPKSRTLEVFGSWSNACETWLDTTKGCIENRWKSQWKGVTKSEWSDWSDDCCVSFIVF